MDSVNLFWSTPDGEKKLGYMARVSNPKASPDDDSSRLIKYLIDHKHWSPFEMVNICFEIHCERDISRQILRHRSLTFQEFSGRYSEYGDLAEYREVRLQDTKNRQNSIPVSDPGLERKWRSLVGLVRGVCIGAYRSAIAMGIAKEVARILLPEGLVPTKMYANGSLRSWIHYISVRCGPETQKEHREIAEKIREEIFKLYPSVAAALV